MIYTWLAFITSQWRTPSARIIDNEQHFRDVTYDKFHIDVKIVPDLAQGARLITQTCAWAFIDAIYEIFDRTPEDQPSDAGTPKALWSVPTYNINAYSSNALGTFTTTKDDSKVGTINELYSDIYFTGQRMSMKSVLFALFGLFQVLWRFRFDDAVSQAYSEGMSVVQSDVGGVTMELTFWELGTEAKPVTWLDIVDSLKMMMIGLVQRNQWESADAVISSSEVIAFLNVRWCLTAASPAGTLKCPKRPSISQDTTLTAI